MKTKYAVYYAADPYEPEFLHFVSTDKGFVKWYVEECNKCLENGCGGYHYREYTNEKCIKPFNTLYMGFLFNLDTGVLLDSYVSAFPVDDLGADVEENVFKSNGKGHSYEECLLNAKGRYTVYHLSKLFGFGGLDE